MPLSRRKIRSKKTIRGTFGFGQPAKTKSILFLISDSALKFGPGIVRLRASDRCREWTKRSWSKFHERRYLYFDQCDGAFTAG